MTIHEYLSKKYNVKTPTTMTKVEAKLFGIPYPLKPGWLALHGAREIAFHAYMAINTALEKHAAKKPRKPRAPRQPRLPRESVREAKRSSISVTSDAFLMSFEWRKIRMVVLKKFGAKCQCCGATPADGAKMNVDHIKPRKLFPSLALVESNLQVLCGECNHGKGNWDQTDWRGIK